MKAGKVPSRKGAVSAAPNQKPLVEPATRSHTFLIVGSLLLGCASLMVYAQTFHHGYVFYDDDWYVYDNPHVKAGLTIQSLSWAFTTFYFANWHPLTWITYLLDHQLFGANPGAEHAVNLAFHIGSTVLMFWAFVRMTQKRWHSAVLAGIFALHPLHVESVAWIAERKDVLSTFFLMVTLLFYVLYVENPKAVRYAAVALAFGLSLLAKPMAVTFPFVLLLLDYWPLSRLRVDGARLHPKGVLWEKAPLLLMSAVASALTYVAQKNWGAVASLTNVPWSDRVGNALVSYVSYIGMSLWPVNLAVLYPPRELSGGVVLVCGVILLGITAWAVAAFRSRPYFFVGWFWYVGMLFPVIGLVQVGLQSMADRYTYLPMVGLSAVVIWGVGDAVSRSPVLSRAAVTVAIVVLVALATGTYLQAAYWQDSKTLFEHTLAVTEKNSVIQNNLGVVLQREGRHEEAVALYRKALDGFPDYAAAHANLGHELIHFAKFDEAFAHIKESLRLRADTAEPQADMGVLLAAQGNFQEAAVHLEKSVTLEPNSADAHSNYCYVLQHLSQLDKAVVECQAALKIKPDAVDAYFNLGNVFLAKGQMDAAAAQFSRALQIDPNSAAARMGLEQAQGARRR